MTPRSWLGSLAMASVVGLAGCPVWAQVAVNPQAEMSVSAWLLRAHEASRLRAYTGTFVVSSSTTMSSAHIWHVCDGNNQMERVEALSGTPRSTFRRNDQVITFFPESKLAVSERRETLGQFPNILRSSDAPIGDYYQLRALGGERVVGLDADVVQLVPKDSQRYGYKIWSDKKSGLILKIQVHDATGRVLEQSAFSELQMDAPVSMSRLSSMMSATDGFRLERRDAQKVDPLEQGWAMKQLVAGFKPAGCYQRLLQPASGASGTGAGNGSEVATLQWMFSDGLATISIFVDAYDPRRHLREGTLELGGATHSVSRRHADWWITAVGEAPPATLLALTQGLERRK